MLNRILLITGYYLIFNFIGMVLSGFQIGFRPLLPFFSLVYFSLIFILLRSYLKRLSFYLSFLISSFVIGLTYFFFYRINMESSDFSWDVFQNDFYLGYICYGSFFGEFRQDLFTLFFPLFQAAVWVATWHLVKLWKASN